MLDSRVQRGNQGLMEPLVSQESLAPVASEEILDTQDVEV